MHDLMPLVEPLIPSLRRYARSMIRDRETADDLVQDCLERVVSRWHQRRADGNPRAWVFTILHNLAMNQLKRSARRGTHVGIEDADESVLAVPGSQENHLQLHRVLGLLAALPEDQRSVLLLVSVEALSYSEAADVLGVPLGTVMSRLSRARHRLHAMMETGMPDRRHNEVHLRSVK